MRQVLRTGAAMALVSWAGSGCALTAPAPGGALREGAFLQGQPTWAASFAPASAAVHRTAPSGPGNAVALSGNGQSFGGDQGLAALGTVIPIGVTLRQSIGPRVDIALDGGWADSGAEVRIGVDDPAARWPVVLSAGARTGRLGLLQLHGDSYQARLRIEAYPPLHDSIELPKPSARGVLSLGAAFGSFVHDMAIPAEPDPNPPDIIGPGPPHVLILRPELRIEGMLGLEWIGHHVSLLLALAPWVVAVSGTAKSANSDWMVDAFSQDIGVSLLASFALGSDLAVHDSASVFSR